MAIFKINLEVKFANQDEIDRYYESATKNINLLLEKYDIRNYKGKIEKVYADQIKGLLSVNGFFQTTPFKSIFFNKKQQFVPYEVIHVFRSIVSHPPVSIKATFLKIFISLLKDKGWNEPLSAYFEKHYNIPADGIIYLENLEDISLGIGVYKATFQLRTAHKVRVSVFLKRSKDIDSSNEVLYSHLQKELLKTARYAKTPYILTSKVINEQLLISPTMPGVASDIILSTIFAAYRKSKKNEHKLTFKRTLEVLIEAFICHAVLGDLLGRNDRHLENSLITFVVEGIPQQNPLGDFVNSEKILTYARYVATNNTSAISLIDIDLKWLLTEKNATWVLADIDFGLSELNLLSLLAEFNNYNSKVNPFFEKRKAYIAHYFNVYCQKLSAILEKKELLFSVIDKVYPQDVSTKKLQILAQTIILFEKCKEPVVKLFKRYLLNYRTRLVHKETLLTLGRIAKNSNNIELLNTLKEAKLLKYLPPWSILDSYDPSVFLQLQCFRGVISKEYKDMLFENNMVFWETVAVNISMVTEKFNSKLFQALEDKKHFIKKDSEALLNSTLLPLSDNIVG